MDRHERTVWSLLRMRESLIIGGKEGRYEHERILEAQS
jgi:hypothetical protein